MQSVAATPERPERRWTPQRTAAVLASIVIVAVVIYARFQDGAFFTTLRTGLFDFYAWDLNRPAHAADDIVVIDIDDDSIQKIGQWPWPRTYLARMANAASRAGAAVIAFDMVFPEPDRLSPDALSLYIQSYDADVAASLRAMPNSDTAFADALASAASVLGVVARTEAGDERPTSPGRFLVGGASAKLSLPPYRSVIGNLPALQTAAAGLGVTNTFPDGDGVIRRMPLVFQIGETLYPSLALEAVRAHRSATTLMVAPAGDDRIGSISIGDVRVATDGPGSIWPSFARMRFHVEPAHRLASGQTDPAFLAGKILFVGVSASGAAAVANIGRGLQAPGHYLQAAAAGAILTGTAAYRPDYLVGVETAAAAVAAALFLAAAAFGNRLLAFGLLIGAPAATFALSYFRYMDAMVLIDPTPLAVALLAVGLFWGAYLLLAQRLSLLYERAFVGRVVGQMSEGLIVTDRAGAVVSANPAAERLIAGQPDLIVETRPRGIGNGAEAAARRVIEDARNKRVLEVDSARIDDRGQSFQVHVVRDVTELKQAQDSAALASARLSSATSSMAEGLMLFDRQGTVGFHNPAIRALAGLSDATDLTAWDYGAFMAAVFLPADAANPIPAPDFHARLTQLKDVGELGEERRTRSGRWLLIRERATANDGMVGVYTDITQLKEAEAKLRDARLQAESANEAKNRFLATVSHELRTPLNAILGFTDSMHQEIFGPIENIRYRDYLQFIMSSGNELLDLVENLLDVASAEAADLKIDLQPINLGNAVNRVATSFRPQFDKVGMRLDLNLPEAMPPCMLDPRAIRRVLANLVSNGLKHGGGGDVVTVSADYRPGEGHVLEVADSGDGMTPDQIARAFEPFWQGQDAAQQTTSQGMGLGLPLVKTLVERQGGSIAIESRPGAGAAVRVLFPDRNAGVADVDAAGE